MLQARENAAKRDLQKRQEMDDNATEMANHMYGDLLTENPAVAQSAFGPHRVVPDRWKGMSPEQLADIKRTQEQQMKEKKVRLLIAFEVIINIFFIKFDGINILSP